MLIVKTHFLMFGHLAWSDFEGCLSHSKSPSPQSHKWENPGQVHTRGYTIAIMR